jgi:predicted  nucleic acid-binding Zn-ribbon protein
VTVAEWIGMASGIIGTLTGSTALGRLLVTHGADRERLRVHEAWIASTGVERGDFQNLTRRVEEAERDCVPRREFDNLADRVHDVEGEVTEVRTLLTDIRLETGRIATQLSANKELMETRFEGVTHQLRNVRQALEGLSRQHPSFIPPQSS